MKILGIDLLYYYCCMNLVAWSLIAVFTILLYLHPAESKDFKILDLTEASINYKKFHPNNYAPYFLEPQHERLTLQLNTQIVGLIFFNNRVHGTTDSAQYRFIGWNFQLGVPVASFLDVLYEHHSQHVLDANRGRWPVEDSVGMTLYFYRDKKVNNIFSF